VIDLAIDGLLAVNDLLDVSTAQKVSSGVTSTNSHAGSRPLTSCLFGSYLGVIASDDDAHVVIIPGAVLVSRARETCARAPIARMSHC
jgi:hypothetical protein